MKKQRLFFALWPKESVRRMAREQARGLLGEGQHLVSEEKLHVTLAYLGRCGPEQLECISRGAGHVTARCFSLRLDRWGWWKRPQVAWIGPKQTPAELSHLVQQLWTGLADCGFRPEFQDYRSHMTLLRKVREPPVVARLDPVEWVVADFVLMESVSTHAGVAYRVVQSWKLAE